jgi:hypothetical protein
VASVRNRGRAVRRRVDRTEELGRFGRLVGLILAVELVVFLWITGGFRILG